MRFEKVSPVKSPKYSSPNAAGIDFYVPEGIVRNLDPGGSTCITSGIRMSIPDGYALIAFNKSGIALRKGLIVGACVIDSDYQGVIHLHVINTGINSQVIRSGEKLVQFLLTPISRSTPIEVLPNEALFINETERGSKGFGSTGVE